MKNQRLADPTWRKRVGFDNIATIADLLVSMPKEAMYAKMNQLEAAGYYYRRTP